MDVTDELLAQALDAIAATGGYSQELPEFGNDLSRDDRLDVISALLARHWVTASTNYGDNRLYAVRAIRITADGHAAHAALLAEVVGEPGEPVALTLDEKRALRLKVMSAVYALTDGSERQLLRVADLIESNGWPPRAAQDAVAYLKQEGLLRPAAWGVIAITHAGVVEVEQSLSAPDKPTAHFPPSTTNHLTIVGNVVGSSLQQAGAGSSQEAEVVSDDHRVRISALLEQIRAEVLPLLAEGSEDYDDLETELDVLDRQLAAKRPRAAAVSAGLSRLAGVLSTAAGAGENIETLAHYAAEIHRVLPGI